MRTNPDLIRWLAAFCLAVVAGANAVFPSPPQDGVAGAPPVFSSPKNQPPPDAKKIEELSKIRVQSLLVTAPVTVLNSAGEFVYDLEENEFEVLDNGVPQRLERFEVMGRPLAVVVLVQTDDTVAPLLPHVRSLAPVFSSLVLGLQGKAAVVSYDDRVRVLQDFSNDGDRLAVTLKELVGRGGKARLNDALTRAVEMLGKRPRDERRIIVAFSDGFDSGSETVKEEVVRQATSVEVTVYGLGFNPAEELLARKPEPPPPSPLDTNVTRPLPPGTVPTPTNSQNVYGTYVPVVPILIATGEIIRSAVASSSLEYYSGYTGGVFYSHWSKKALEDQLTRIASEIHSQYELAYVPDTLNQPGFHRIEVQVRRPGVKVRARAGYFYQRSTQ